MFFNQFVSIFSFLTIIPLPKANAFDLNIIARSMHYFPLCGAIIGVIVGLVAFVSSTFLPQYITSFVILVTFVIITGVHHIDALADFADGLMKKGDRASKRKAMSDPLVGSAGATALIINFIGLYIALSSFESSHRLFYVIIAAEIIAKYIMVMQASIGTSAWSGFSSPFTRDEKKIQSNCICHNHSSIDIHYRRYTGFTNFRNCSNHRSNYLFHILQEFWRSKW